MPNRVVVAVMAAVGLLSSTFALAEVTDGSARKTVSNALEAPVLVANNVAMPVTVEPESQISASTHAADGALATAIYYEARSESLAGQLAVAHVVLQRAKSGRFPSSLCGVVTQPGQFSFVRGGRLPAIPGNANQWRTARAIAQIARDGSWANPVQGALFFHATRVSPGWAKERVTRIGGHVFYR